MQPCSREIQTTVNSILNPSLQDLQNSHFDPSTTTTTAAAAVNDDFFDQVLSSIPSGSWTDLTSTSANHLDLPGDGIHHFDDSALLASKLQQHQIDGGESSAAAMLLHQQLLMARTGGLINGGDFERSQEGGDGRIQSMYNGFAAGSMNGSGHPSILASHFQHPQNFTAQAAVMNQAPAASESTGGGTAPVQPKQRVRARRGQATDPHSIAERLRRERIAERMKALQELVPNANKTDKASMLDEIIDYVKFLQLQVKVLSMSRLGGAAAVAPLVGDLSSEGGDSVQGGSRSNNGNQAASSNDNLTVTEHQVAKLMEEDMGSAMQYLQGKGLCLMPISLATAISTATCQSRNPMINNHLASNGEGPSSPSVSVLTVQSATLGNGALDGSMKDAASVSKP